MLWSCLGSPRHTLAQPRVVPQLGVVLGLADTHNVPDDDDEQTFNSPGALAQLEYQRPLNPFWGFIGYTGVLWSWDETSDDLCGVTRSYRCEVSSRVALLGLRARGAIPFPWVAPFAEMGFGLSFGSLRTYSNEHHKRLNGISGHIPFTLGLALGPSHGFELALRVLFHPDAKQNTGVFALGMGFPI